MSFLQGHGRSAISVSSRPTSTDYVPSRAPRRNGALRSVLSSTLSALPPEYGSIFLLTGLRKLGCHRVTRGLRMSRGAMRGRVAGTVGLLHTCITTRNTLLMAITTVVLSVVVGYRWSRRWRKECEPATNPLFYK